MLGNPEKEIDWAVITLLDESHHLPASLVTELRNFHGDSDVRPPKLAMKQDACYMLLEYAEELPSSLEAELTGYVAELDGPQPRSYATV